MGYLLLHWNASDGVVKRSLSLMFGGSIHLAIPGSTKSFFTHSANHRILQSQYRGFEPRALEKWIIIVAIVRIPIIIELYQLASSVLTDEISILNPQRHPRESPICHCHGESCWNDYYRLTPFLIIYNVFLGNQTRSIRDSHYTQRLQSRESVSLHTLQFVVADDSTKKKKKDEVWVSRNLWDLSRE